MAEENSGQNPQPQVNYAALTTSLLNALDARQDRADNAVIQSFAEQNDVSESDLSAALGRAWVAP